jgi:hypothetical protein
MVQATSGENEQKSLACEFYYYHWHFSPFRGTLTREAGFWLSLLFGLVYVCGLGIGYIIDHLRKGAMHQRIALIDLGIVMVMAPLLW